MKIWAKIRALFNFRGELAEVELSSAEIRKDKIFLHPSDDANHTFCIKAANVDILINPASELTEDDIFVMDNEKTADEACPECNAHQEPNDISVTENLQLAPTTPDREPAFRLSVTRKHDATGKGTRENYYRGPQMRVVSFRLYPEEYDMLMTNIQTNGYRKTEYLLACIAAAKKNSMEATYKQYFAAHQERRKAEREAARRAKKEADNILV